MRLSLPASALLMMAISTGAAQAQSKSPRLPATVSGSTAHYFQLSLNLTFGANGEQQATTQTITTEFAIRGSIPGSSKARMVSQTPTGSGTGTRYIEVGTKFDADDIHLEGDAVALHFVLSASRPVKMIRYTQSDGKEMEEPIIAERNIELSIKLPLNESKVVFDSSSRNLAPLKPLAPNSKDDPATAAAGMPQPDQPIVVEMTVTELK